MPKHVGPEINNPDPGAVLIVGRDPGAHEVEQGRPFVGPSGKLFLDGMYRGNSYIPPALSKAGLRRDDVNITNVVPYRPWNNKFYNHSWDRINEGLQQLQALIDQLSPSLIIATGNAASYALVKDWDTTAARKPGDKPGGKSIKSAKKIMDRRGYLWEGSMSECPVYTTLHPSAALRSPVPEGILLDGDMKRVGMYLRGDLQLQSFPTPTIVRTPSDIEDLYDSSLVAWDIEIKWGGDDLLCVAFADDDLNLYVAHKDALPAVEDFLASDVPKVAHNGQFDTYFMEHKMGVPVGGVWEDTMIAWWAAYLELAGRSETGGELKKNTNQMTRKGLAFLGSWDILVPYWKEYTSDPDRMAELCARDVFVTRQVWNHRHEDMVAKDVIGQYERTRDMIPALNKMQARGIRIDKDLWKSRRSRILERQAEKEEEARSAAMEILQTYDLTHKENGDEHIWYHDAQCPCCNGGKTKSEQCWSCAGFDDSPSKQDLVALSHEEGIDPEGMLKADLERALLDTCRECNGVGTIPTWDFNPLSSHQLSTLLYDYLDVPQYTLKGDDKNAKEETMKRVREWAEGGFDKGINN